MASINGGNDWTGGWRPNAVNAATASREGEYVVAVANCYTFNNRIYRRVWAFIAEYNALRTRI